MLSELKHNSRMYLNSYIVAPVFLYDREAADEVLNDNAGINIYIFFYSVDQSHEKPKRNNVLVCLHCVPCPRATNIKFHFSKDTVDTQPAGYCSF